MSTKYIIDNLDGSIPQQIIYGSLSATTLYGDGSNLIGLTPSYKSFTAYYNVEEGILQVYENTIGSINFSYDSPSNEVIITSSNLFGSVDNGTPEKTVIFLTVRSGTNGLRGSVSSSSVIGITDTFSTPGGMSANSVKFFIEIRVYN